MALPDYFKIEQGTPIIWGEAGASGVTLTLSMDALANGAAVMGASADLGATFDEEYYVEFRVETGTAPTAGTIAILYLVSSYDNSATSWPGRVTGSAAAYPPSGTLGELLRQLGPPAVVLVADNANNLIVQQQGVIWRPPTRYVVPVVLNTLGQAFRDEATATNNDSRVIMVPRRALVQDTA